MGACEACRNDQVYTPEGTQHIRPLKSPNTLSVESNESEDHVSLSDTSSSEQEELYDADPSTKSNSSTAADEDASDFMKIPTCHSWNTQRLNDINDGIFAEMSDALQTKQQDLEVYSGWMDKKQSSAPYSWLKRWVVVKEGYILWSEWQMTVEHEMDDKEMQRWNKCIYLARNGTTVSEVKSKRNRRFKLITPKREFLFRTRDKSERDQWMNTLKQHIEYAKEHILFGSCAV
eukprot:47452_1